MRYFSAFVCVVLLFLSLFSFVPSVHASRIAVPIVMYHYIRDYHSATDTVGNQLSVSPSNFDAQMAYLSSHGYTPISLDTLYGIFNNQVAAPAKPIVLTFDDGYIDFFANAYPILKKYGFHATSFVITGFVGKPAYLSWENIKAMQSSGLINFESHTVNHVYLPSLSYTSALKELEDSKTTLEAETGYPVHFIAYPSGGSNSLVWNAATKAGYIGGLGTWRGKASYPSINMPRVRINGNDSLLTFIQKL